MLAHGGLAGGAGGHDEDLRGALEGMAQARGVAEVSLAYPGTTLAEPAGLLRAADADANLGGGHPLEEPLSDTPAKLAAGSGNDDHVNLLRPVAR